MQVEGGICSREITSATRKDMITPVIPCNSETSILSPSSFDLATGKINISDSTNCDISREAPRRNFHKDETGEARLKSVVCHPGSSNDIVLAENGLLVSDDLLRTLDEDPKAFEAPLVNAQATHGTMSAMSVFRADDVILEARRQGALLMGRRLLDKLIRLPFSQVRSFENEAEKIFHAIAATEVVDPSPLRTRVQGFMNDVDKYLFVKSAFSQRVTPEVKLQRRIETQRHLDSAIHNRDNERGQISSWQSELLAIQSEQTQLRDRLQILEEDEQRLNGLISQGETKVQEHEIPIKDAERVLTELDAVPELSNQDVSTLATLQQLLVDAREELKSLDWM